MSTPETTEHSEVSASRPEQATTSPPPSEGTATGASLRTSYRRDLPFLAMATLWLSSVFAVSRDSAMGVFSIGFGVLLLGIPMCLAAVCTSTLRRRRWLSGLFWRQGWLYAALSGRWLTILSWTAVGLLMSFLLLLHVHVYTRVEWVVLAATIPLFTVVFASSQRRLLKAGLHADVAVTEALVFSRWFCPAIVVLLQVAAMVWWGDLPQHASVEAAIAAHTPEAAERSGSTLVREALHWAGYFDGLKAYALGNLGSPDGLAVWLVMGLLVGNYVLLYYACVALSCFRIPRAGFVRARLAPRSTEGVFKVAAVATFLIPFVYFPLLAQLEAFVSQSPHAVSLRTKAQETITPIVRVVVEQIDRDYFREGTLEQIARARSEAALPVGAAAEQLRREVDATFNRLESEAVDEYLDWYYSLTAEWGRLVKLLAGGVERLEGHLAEKVRETFEQEKWYAGINTAFERLMAADEEARKAYEQTVRAILEHNRVGSQRLQDVEIDIASIASLEGILKPSFHQDFVPAAHRFLGASGGGVAVAGSVGTIIAQKVKTKILAKLVLKVAAKAPLKALASKAGSAAVAAVTGAAAGSVVPGLGTAVGAAGGAVVGFGTGVAIDGVLLELEEALSRDDFRREIVIAIREARREIEDQMLGTPNPPKPASP